MPGVFVVAGDRFTREQRSRFVRKMIELDRERTTAPFGPTRDWVIETADDDFASLGCAHLGVWSNTTIATREAPRRLTAAAFGNISLRDGDPVARMPNAEDAILDMYLESGSGFADRLEGDFVIVISDPEEERLLVVNDRLGLIPHYISDPPGLFAMAPNLSAVACLPGVDDEVDMVGLSDLLTFGYVLMDDTIVRGVKVLSPASASDYSGGRWQKHSYWELKVEPGRTPRASTEEHVGRIGELMSDAVRRCVPDTGKVTVSLSGGLDSRFVACMLHREGIPFDAFTLGADDACEVKFARMLCERLGVRHTVEEPRYHEALERLSWLAARQDGMVNVFHNFCGSHRLGAVTSRHGCVLTGLLGGIIAGWHATPIFWLRRNSPADFLLDAYHALPAEATSMVLDRAREEPHAAHSRFRTLAQRAADESGFAAVQRYDCCHEQRKFTTYGNQSINGMVATASPFTDDSVVSYFIGLPFRDVYLKRLYRAVIASLFPETADVPYTFVDLPPAAGSARILWRRFGKRSRLPEPLWQLWRRLFWVPDHSGHRHLDMERLLELVFPQLRDFAAREAEDAVPGLSMQGLNGAIQQREAGGPNHSVLLQHVFSYVTWYRSRPAKFDAGVPG